MNFVKILLIALQTWFNGKEIPDEVKKARDLYNIIGTGVRKYVEQDKEKLKKKSLRNLVGDEDVNLLYSKYVLYKGVKQLTPRDLLILKRCYQDRTYNTKFARTITSYENASFRTIAFERFLGAPYGKLVKLLTILQNHWDYITAAGAFGLLMVSAKDYVRNTAKEKRSFTDFLKKTLTRLWPHNVRNNKLFYIFESIFLLGLSLKATQLWLEPWLLGEGKEKDPNHAPYMTWRSGGFRKNKIPQFVAQTLKNQGIE